MSNSATFRYLELCPSVQSRGGIVTYPEGYADQISKFFRFPYTAAFRSVFLYDEAYLGYFREHHSIRGYSGLAWGRDALVDLDDNASIENALEAARRVTWRLVKDYLVSPGVVRVWFTGNRGFHIAIPQPLIGFSPSQDLPAQMARFWRLILDGCLPATTKFDDSIYGFNKLIRVPGSFHEKSKRYKIMLTVPELLSLSVEEILQLSQARRIMAREKPELRLNMPLVETWRLACQTPKRVTSSPHGRGMREVDSAAIYRAPILTLLKTPVLPGSRNNVAYRIASELVWANASPAEVESRLMHWNQNLAEPLPDHELQQVIRSAEHRRAR